MVQLTRIYTKGGDKGKTSLGSGTRVLKNALRIESIGTVDEANAWVGMILKETPSEHQNFFRQIQNDLFDLGADLCMEDLTQENILRIKEDRIDWLEKKIDSFNAELAPLNSFVLPGGTALSSVLHMGRVVARRAERSVVALMQEEQINAPVLRYLNRLSDLFFVLARFFNDKGARDLLWKPGGSQE